MTGTNPKDIRVHVMGGSGVGTTTLGAALARRTGAAHLDSDEYYWEPTDPPFRVARPAAERLTRLERATDASPRFVSSGSLCGWGDPLIPRFQLVVFLRVPTAVRIARLKARELERFGKAALAPGGAMHEGHEEFLAWAAEYDTGDGSMRSLARHTKWLADLPCPVLRLDGREDVEALVDRVLEAL